MRVLVYGAGVIGCYLAHVLCGAGQDVTLLARGEWKETLQQKGLVIEHRLQRKTTTDHPTVIGALDETRYDAVFAVMQHYQMKGILPELARVNSPLVVLVGNNLSASEMEREILAHTKTPKTVLFGFQGTGGRRENDRAICVRFGAESMTLGRLHGAAQEGVMDAVRALFVGTKYRLTWESEMDAWLHCHLALILPVAYLCYITGCDLRQATRYQRKLLLDAAGEGDALLKKLGYPMAPAGEDAWYRPGPKRLLMQSMVLVMAKTALGDLAASDHCRHAVTEMEGLDAAWELMRFQKRKLPMPAWDELRNTMPSWESLHQIYG